MSLASRLITALVGLGLIWFFWPFGGGSDEVVQIVEPPTGHEGRLFTRPVPPQAETVPVKPEAPKTAKAPKTEAPPETPTAQEEDGETVAAIAPEKPAAPNVVLKPKRFYRVVVRDGGTLEASDTVITLSSIKVRAADATCKDAKGRSWACGKRSRVALMRLIRGRAVSCKVPASGTAKTLTARCTVGGTDLSMWMVTQGWAEPAAPAETKLAKAADMARKKKIGIWR